MAKQYDINPVWIEKRGLWRARVQKNGVRKEFTSSTPGRAGKREVLERAEKWLAGGLSDRDPTVAEVAAEWLEKVLQNTGKTSWRQYNTHVRNYIVPVIGSLHMSQLTNEQQLQDVIDKAFRCGVRDGRELSAKTLTNLRGTITAILRYARKAGYTTLHAENVQIPKRARRGERRAMQPDELRILFSVDTVEVRGKSVPEWFIYAFRFMTLTSLRPGELRGLKWSDIDRKTVHISRSINGYNETTAGKNANARRTFVLPELAVEILRNQRTMLEEAGIQSEYVFPDRKGGSAAQDALRRHLKHYCESCGIVPVSPYELRHTWFSINKALPRELVKMMGGHSESMDTFGVYGHELDGEREKMASLLDGVLQALLHPADGT